MAKSSNQKSKILRLIQIFSEETDEEHGLTLKQIIDKLSFYNIKAERKSLYQDIDLLRSHNFDIEIRKVGKNFKYFLMSREFELAELKLLVDSVQSSRFITDKKSNSLITKLESLVSKHQANQLQRQVVTSGRIKTMNESIYYNVDNIHEATNQDKQITFQYFQYDINKNRQLRHNGKIYKVSPWSLMWDNENYYLIAFDQDDNQIKHYRVDKMLRISISNEIRLGQVQFKKFNLPHYANSLFGMFGGKETTVTLKVNNELVSILIDRFGKDIPIIKIDKDHFQTCVNVIISNQFFGWLISLGDKITIISPDDVVIKLKEEISRLTKQYNI